MPKEYDRGDYQEMVIQRNHIMKHIFRKEFKEEIVDYHNGYKMDEVELKFLFNEYFYTDYDTNASRQKMFRVWLSE